MNGTHKQSHVTLDAITAAMLLALGALGLRRGDPSLTQWLDVVVIIVGYAALALWARAAAVASLADEPPGDLRLVRRDGTITVYHWEPADTPANPRRPALDEKEPPRCEHI